MQTQYIITQLRLLCENLFINIDFGKYDERFLLKCFQGRMQVTHAKEPLKYIDLITKNPKELGLFLDSFHINYSEFFRNPLTYSVLENIIIPYLLNKKKNTRSKEIRVWSTACAVGQEAYSIAMLMEEYNNISTGIFNYRIFGTDYSETNVIKAIKGKYTSTELRMLNMKKLNQWFSYKDNIYSIKKVLKKNIEFSVFDLFNKELRCPPDSIFGHFDIVMCANLLFYYKKDFQKIILNKVENCLAKGGYIITGETERDILLKYGFNEVYPYSAIFQVK